MDEPDWASPLVQKNLRLDVYRDPGQVDLSRMGEVHVRITDMPTGVSATGHDPEHPADAFKARAVAVRLLLDQLAAVGEAWEGEDPTAEQFDAMLASGEPVHIEVTREEFEEGKRLTLERLGLTYEELEDMARRRDFVSTAAHVAWVAIGGGYGDSKP